MPLTIVQPGGRVFIPTATEGTAPMSFSSESLPQGMLIDTNSGKITGHAPSDGVYCFTITASNAAGISTVERRVMSLADCNYDTSVQNKFVSENSFLSQLPDLKPVPTFAQIKDLLPIPTWQGHDQEIACYWKAWELAFKNIHCPPEKSPFISDLIDPAFNGCIFMWDSVFMMMFGTYGERAFHFQGTLDNLYAMQHRDGYICREIQIGNGHENFTPESLSSTGPNLMPWAEWEYYQKTGDIERLRKVFPALLAYSQWFRKYRTWQDGSYFSSGWGCGMDNQPRLPGGFSPEFDNGFISWIDITLQAIFTDKILVKMASVLKRNADVQQEADEITHLTDLVNSKFWDDTQAFYFDRMRDGTLSQVKSIGAYWALLAGIVPPQNRERFIAHLSNPNEFKRPHQIPSLSADSPRYQKTGGYWRGGVWSPTNYMVLRGLTESGDDSLAHDIAMNHLGNVTEVFQKTGTLWENYAPESAAPGQPARHDFVGWTGISPITILFEYVFGLRPNVPERELLWDVRLLEEHGVTHYAFGKDTLLDLNCAQRKTPQDEPVITAKTTKDLTLRVKWAGGERVLKLRPE